ncbi:MAG: aldehyde dehydrogenase family protein [Culicoidibacterales bacterium]
MMEQRISQIHKQQKHYFSTNQTKQLATRKAALKNLYKSICNNETAIIEALQKDLGKPLFEIYTTEIGIIKKSIKTAIKQLDKWAKPQKVATSMITFGAKSQIQREPLGLIYIIGPFNYPFQLVMQPLIGAIAAGNTAIIKPSEQTQNVSKIIAKIIEEAFNKQYVCVIEGGRQENEILLNQPSDLIFFTGSSKVGKIIMEKAAKNLTPVILELGGKSPVIIDGTTNLTKTAQRIIWGKLLNTGQTCIAPDYILVQNQHKKALISELIKAVEQFYPKNNQSAANYGKIISQTACNRLINLIKTNHEAIVFGGDYNSQKRYIGPTIFDCPKLETTLMEEEIFGPLLPVFGYGTLEEAITIIKGHSKPLALYLFSQEKVVVSQILSEISSGSVAINQTILQVANEHLPFGGVGASGMGNYHGIYSFQAFSHSKSILKQSMLFQPKYLFPPYSEKLTKLVQRRLK